MITSEVFQKDNIEGMKEYKDKYFDLALVDPPYGLGDRLTKGAGELVNSSLQLYKDKNWDASTPPAEYWKELFRVSKNQIVFGMNYFMEYLPSSRGIICWDKKQRMPSLSAIELAWTSYDMPAKIYEIMSNDRYRFHPCQKPVELYDFCLQYAKIKPNMKILDTHLGSGATRISADKANCSFVGFELDGEYIEKHENRWKEYKSHTKLF